jgi:hypothetical protein
MKKWVRELTKEGVQLDREKMKEEPKGPSALSEQVVSDELQ